MFIEEVERGGSSHSHICREAVARSGHLQEGWSCVYVLNVLLLLLLLLLGHINHGMHMEAREQLFGAIYTYPFSCVWWTEVRSRGLGCKYLCLLGHGYASNGQ